MTAVPRVLESAVILVDDELLTEAVVALVVTPDGATLVETTDLRRACRENMETFMIPRPLASVDTQRAG